MLDTIRKVVGHDGSFTALHIPVFEGNEKHYLAECVDSNFVSSIGEFVDRFEGMLAAFTGVKRAVLCVNGTHFRSNLFLVISLYAFQVKPEIGRYAAEQPRLHEVKRGITPVKREQGLVSRGGLGACS
jgi:hypothetical protein